MKWRALLVDIDDYKTLSELSYAVADVKLLRERLSQLDFASVTMLTTGARNDLLPDKENIEDSFNELVDSATETDCLFIMFSGRSYESNGQSWFAPTGARGPSSPERSININDLMTRLNKAKRSSSSSSWTRLFGRDKRPQYSELQA